MAMPMMRVAPSARMTATKTRYQASYLMRALSNFVRATPKARIDIS
jgi:hypothetical protein